MRWAIYFYFLLPRAARAPDLPADLGRDHRGLCL